MEVPSTNEMIDIDDCHHDDDDDAIEQRSSLSSDALVPHGHALGSIDRLLVRIAIAGSQQQGQGATDVVALDVSAPRVGAAQVRDGRRLGRNVGQLLGLAVDHDAGRVRVHEHTQRTASEDRWRSSRSGGSSGLGSTGGRGRGGGRRGGRA